MKEQKIEISKPEDVCDYVYCPNCPKTKDSKLKYQQGKGYNYCKVCKIEYLFVIN